MKSSGRFLRHMDALSEILALAEVFSCSVGLAPTLRYTLEFVLEELFTNRVKYNPLGEGDIAIELSLQEGELKIIMTDFDSDRFDINTDAPDVDLQLPLELRKPGGLGLHLVKRMMDRIEYHHDHRVSTLCLYKRIE